MSHADYKPHRLIEGSQRASHRTRPPMDRKYLLVPILCEARNTKKGKEIKGIRKIRGGARDPYRTQTPYLNSSEYSVRGEAGYQMGMKIGLKPKNVHPAKTFVPLEFALAFSFSSFAIC